MACLISIGLLGGETTLDTTNPCDSVPFLINGTVETLLVDVHNDGLNWNLLWNPLMAKIH